MRRLGGAARIVLALLTLASIYCNSFPAQALSRENSKVKVVATLFPQFDFTRQIGKDKVEVVLVLPPGVEAHSFEPKPRDMARINEADLFIYTGKYMEPWVEGLLKGISNISANIIDVSKGVKLVASDPHIWLDMDNASMMVDNITAALIAKDPANKDYYIDNAKEYKLKLKSIDDRCRNAFKDCKYDTFVYAGHPAFGYFARRYGLTCLSPYKSLCPDSEPAPKSIMEVVDKMREKGIRYVYYEELLSPKLARTIAAETSSNMLPLNGAHNVSKADMDKGVTFLSILEEDLKNLKKGMECKSK
jgi:zinc transport system substrate-binding protein